MKNEKRSRGERDFFCLISKLVFRLYMVFRLNADFSSLDIVARLKFDNPHAAPFAFNKTHMNECSLNLLKLNTS